MATLTPDEIEDVMVAVEEGVLLEKIEELIDIYVEAALVEDSLASSPPGRHSTL